MNVAVKRSSFFCKYIKEKNGYSHVDNRFYFLVKQLMISIVDKFIFAHFYGNLFT